MRALSGSRPEDGERRLGLARAGFAHDAQDLAAVHVEGDVVHDLLDGAVRLRIADAEVGHLDQVVLGSGFDGGHGLARRALGGGRRRRARRPAGVRWPFSCGA